MLRPMDMCQASHLVKLISTTPPAKSTFPLPLSRDPLKDLTKISHELKEQNATVVPNS